MSSNSQVCHEGIQGVYRNSVVRHLRCVLKEAYPEDWRQRLFDSFKQEEIDVVRKNAELRRTTGELGAPLTDDFDLLSVNHFRNLFDKYFDLLFPLPGESEDVRKACRNAILGWAQEVKNLRDPVLGHPGEYDLDYDDAFRFLDSAQRVLGHFDEEASGEFRSLKGRLLSEDSLLLGRVRHPLAGGSLPPRESVAPSFIGRDSELSELRSWISDRHSSVRLLAGAGGMGKTAIAYQFASAVCDDPPLELEDVIWLSAKSRRFESGHSVDIGDPDFVGLESALDCILSIYGAPNVDSMDLDGKRATCREYMDQLPALIVLDDVDSLESDDVSALNFFLQYVGATRCKLLLTSRRVPGFGMEGSTTRVEGFSVERRDGARFVASRLSLLGLPSGFLSGADANRVVDVYGGNPLFIQDLLRLCAIGDSLDDAVAKWRSLGGEQARRYALGREFDFLSPSAQVFLLACALFRGAVSKPDVRLASELSAEDCDEAISELRSLFLLPAPELAGGEPTFRLDLNTRLLVLQVKGDSDSARRVQRRVDEVLSRVPPSRERIARQIRHADSLVRLEDFEGAEASLKNAIGLYPGTADLHGKLGWLYKIWETRPRSTDALEHFALSAKCGSLREDMYRHWAELCLSQEEWSAAAEAAERGLDTEGLGPSVWLSYLAGRSRYYLSKDLLVQAQYDRARQETLRAESHLQRALVDPVGLSPVQFRLHGRAYRTMALNYEQLILVGRQLGRFRPADREERRLLGSLRGFLSRWRSEHPDDGDLSTEADRLRARFPGL